MVSDAEDGGGWLTRANSWMESQFQEYVTNYTPEQRQKALADFARRLARPETIAVIAGVVSTPAAHAYDCGAAMENTLRDSLPGLFGFRR